MILHWYIGTVHKCKIPEWAMIVQEVFKYMGSVFYVRLSFFLCSLKTHNTRIFNVPLFYSNMCFMVFTELQENHCFLIRSLQEVIKNCKKQTNKKTLDPQCICLSLDMLLFTPYFHYSFILLTASYQTAPKWGLILIILN